MRLSVSVHGIVQGVGFRPFVWRQASEQGLIGWVRNERGSVELEVQGSKQRIADFLRRLERISAPARVDELHCREVAERSGTGFEILPSRAESEASSALPPDLATCAECLAEIRTAGERRQAYAFTNCTRCGPRYSIVESLPYDRAGTSMRGFVLCPDCAREYCDPRDRRFHAEPIACPRCGPELDLLDGSGAPLARGPDALEQAARVVLGDGVLAVRSLGGFQLLVDATSERAVTRLRERKQRERKPLAVMFSDLDSLQRAAVLSDAEIRALCSPEAPILLVSAKPSQIAPSIAPNTPRLGVMLPYTPLHHLLLQRLGRPVVCTSGNLSDEPMCIETDEALVRLGAIADAWLVHDRPIVRPVDDSVGRIGPAGLELIRRARGFCPLPVAKLSDQRTIIALGAHMKSTVALAHHGEIVVSQHIGDLEHVATRHLLEQTASDLLEFFSVRPALVACDLHPDYASTAVAESLAKRFSVPLVRVQHHHAHVAAVMAEHALDGPVLGLAWDGTGLGSDGSAWGGEAIAVDRAGFRRIARLRPFRLPGADRAAREPWRAAVGALYELSPAAARSLAERHVGSGAAGILLRALEQEIAAPPTSSIGRLFDAVAALLGAPTRSSFEAEAALELERLAGELDDGQPYPFPLLAGELASADFGPLLRAIERDLAAGVAHAAISARFHESLADLGVRIAELARLRDVVLAGGCMQNLRLASSLRRKLERAGFRVYGAGLVPANDGGVSVGQVLVATATPEARS
jgi:hydrogenase maturation protein HypF